MFIHAYERTRKLVVDEEHRAVDAVGIEDGLLYGPVVFTQLRRGIKGPVRVKDIVFLTDLTSRSMCDAMGMRRLMIDPIDGVMGSSKVQKNRNRTSLYQRLMQQAVV